LEEKKVVVLAVIGEVSVDRGRQIEREDSCSGTHKNFREASCARARFKNGLPAKICRPARNLKESIARKRQTGLTVELRLPVRVPLESEGPGVMFTIDKAHDAVHDRINGATPRAEQGVHPFANGQAGLALRALQTLQPA